ncbi:uncharacterized protein UV8b_05808 [Ustilaginoidea virens]|uniref:Uncharacterized protein n=1 Tax=Ustilaginoidea virens TaxID=1159556 RepID=A0A8E5HTX1_USTVR|nr:uncharacterized protein UV8b_05808 [Ustilaginoidea virens]QUC21565.1 hypothetical protein UV8b_05808 [Ustilaginoidea virens]
MDSSPIVKAHDHAAAAAVATRQSADTTVAINEHTLAAGEFANAARSTTSIEALRTLKLLEHHHRRLAELLKLPPDRHAPPAGEKGALSGEKADGAMSPDGLQSGKKMPSLAQRGFVAREMSSSIANNLASARGIRSKYRGQPLSPSISNDQAPGNVDPHPRRAGSRSHSHVQSLIDAQQQSGRPTWVPPTPPALLKADSSRGSKSAASPPRVEQTTAAAAAAAATTTTTTTTEDAGYARFYNTFGSLINKISAPLAFAGLPLIQEESVTSDQAVEQQHPEPSAPPPPPPPKRKPSRLASTSLSLDPDLSKIYSKATMRALVREGHSTNDSFYVVPTSGHTMSYANILTYAEKEKRRLEASQHSDLDPHGHAEDDDDDFVDARETPVPPASPGARRKLVLSRTEKDLRNTVEELSLENKSLKEMLDNVSKRLHAFEASSQHSAMALAESYRIMRPGSPSAAKPADEALRSKVQDMEEQLAAATTQIERLEKDNRKMQKTLDKYREKWEVLKAGAKARRGAQAESVDEV